jgi:hypothetical protein
MYFNETGRGINLYSGLDKPKIYYIIQIQKEHIPVYGNHPVLQRIAADYNVQIIVEPKESFENESYHSSDACCVCNII